MAYDKDKVTEMALALMSSDRLTGRSIRRT